ncbi:MAG: flagellar assembly protein FliH [Gammaproteobacteria bacterium]|nr:flagellar assembly protein FliH [Gammaproteobacteria bacterium]NNJ90986.1 flagellar assembly protein FliH [Gammaproteobacteria bacterium]
MKNLSKSRIIRAKDAENVSDFRLNDMTDPAQAGKAVARGRGSQMTAAELEKLQEQARQEAYQEGRKEGFEFGHNEALEQYRQHFEERLAAFDRILQSFQKPFENLDEQVENEIVELVISMVKQLVRREVKMDPNHVVGVVREAMSALPVSSQDIILVLNPEDAEIIRDIFSLNDKEQSWRIVEDPVLKRGGCRVTSGDSQIDATLESRLDALIAPLISDERRQGIGEIDDESTDN